MPYTHMKNAPLLLLATVLFTAGCQTTPEPVTTPVFTKGNITVTFKDSEKYTDAFEDASRRTSEYYLSVLAEHLQKIATPLLADGQKLAVTFTDIDLAGDIRADLPQMMNVRLVKEIYWPRMSLSFQLTGADGKVIKEGERSLSDMNFMSNIGITDRNEPLFYDKDLLAQWVRNEFKR
jgi:Protein of unknown function (DUF3016)